MEMVAGWVVLALLMVGMGILSVAFVLLFSRKDRVMRVGGDSDDGENNSGPFVPLLVAGMTIFFVFCCACIIPVDVYSVSSSVDPQTGQRIITEQQINTRQTAIRATYEVLYICVLLLTVVAIPFSHFYYEETGETFQKRAMASCRYAGFMVVILFIAFFIGFILSGNVPEFDVSDTDSAGQNLQAYVKELVDGTSWLQQGLDFTMTVFTLLGFGIYGTYTAYGLSALPISLLKGTKQIDEERLEVQDDLEAIRNKKKELQIGMKGLSMTIEDVDELGELEDRERALTRHNEALEGDKQSCCFQYLRPFFVLFGGLFALFSLFLLICIIATTVERFFQQEGCSFACEFVVTVDWINPLDKGLMFCSRFFPLDIILFGMVIGYMIGVTIYAISSAGIKLIVLSLYRVGMRSTCPQGMLWFVLYLSLAITALNFEMMFLAPQYTTWGSQTYVDTNGDVVPCSMLGGAQEGSTGNNVCTMSTVATMYNSVQIRLPFFGFVFTLANCAFILIWLIGLIWSLCKKQQANFDEEQDAADMIGDDEL